MAAPAKTTTTAPFDVSDASVATLQAAMQSGKTSSQALVRAYLARIKTLDKSGPRINSVIEVNPDALMIARTLDAERKVWKITVENFA